MPQERLSMRTIREVLRLSQQGRSLRFIASSCRISASTARQYLDRAQSAGVVWPLPEDTTDELLDRLLFPAVVRSAAARPVPDWAAVAVDLRRKGVTLFLLWEEYHATEPNAYGYSRYCEMFQEYAGTLDPRMHQVHKAGEKLFVDYAGMMMPVTDRTTGEVRMVPIYVGTLGASDYTYAEATLTQSVPDWIGSQVRNLIFIGGVPEVIVPDNLKSGVTSPCRYEPDINVGYLKFAEYYGVAVIPARVATPRDKAKVENHVLAVERRILAALRDRVFFSIEELNQAIWELLEVLNNRPFQKLPGNRRQLFETLDAPALRPLPTEPYVSCIWSKVRVNIDYHIEVDRAFYSVPYTLLRKELEVRMTARIVEVFYKGNRITSHPRSYVAGHYETTPLHMPKSHREYAEWTPERLVRWARESGVSTAGMVDAILQRHVHPQQGFRSCLGIISLGRKYGAERLEAACGRGLALGVISYKSVKSILDKKLDQAPIPVAAPEPFLPIHSNIRGADYFAAPKCDPQPSPQTAFSLE